MEDEDSRLLKDSLSTVSKFLSGASATNAQSSGRYRRGEETLNQNHRQLSESRPSQPDSKANDENLFDVGWALSSKVAQRYVSRKPSPPRNKVMTPAQFERYRQDKERQDTKFEPAKPGQGEHDEEEDNYEDDEDEAEKSKQAVKQRRKQEAHMTIYRQQMMKVTGEGASGAPSRPGIQMSFSHA